MQTLAVLGDIPSCVCGDFSLRGSCQLWERKKVEVTSLTLSLFPVSLDKFWSCASLSFVLSAIRRAAMCDLGACDYYNTYMFDSQEAAWSSECGRDAMLFRSHHSLCSLPGNPL